MTENEKRGLTPWWCQPPFCCYLAQKSSLVNSEPSLSLLPSSSSPLLFNRWMLVVPDTASSSTVTARIQKNFGFKVVFFHTFKC